MRKGFALLAAALMLPVLIATLGLVADLGRVFAAKAELQTYADAAALAACYELDGTAEGLERARAARLPNRWHLGTQTVATMETTLAQTLAGPYQANPASAAGIRFARVTASGQLPLYFLPILPGVSTPMTVAAEAIAGQAIQTSLGEGLAPFSPDAHDAADPNFGFVPGRQYTLRWPPPGHRDHPHNTCSGDVGFTPAGGSSDRGYIDVGQGGGNSGLHEAIVNNTFNLPSEVRIGGAVSMVTGQDHAGPAIDARFAQDTDTSATTYAAYQGNGRRLLIVAVNDHTDASAILGFALFFLPPNACGNNNTRPCCAEYVGPAAVQSGKRRAASPGLYKVMLFR